jgi:IrrE N-terminal-like domain
MRFSKPQIERIAREFWSTADQVHRLNFDILSAVNASLIIDLIPVQQLSLGNIETWLAARTITIDLHVNDRSLHGALLIKDGSVFMFVDATGDEVQQRFTIAHEVSHFLLDYQLPKERAILALGKEIEDVLNGTSAPTTAQLVLSVIKGINIDPYTFLIEKTGNGSFISWSNFNSENEADYLALELLAPRIMVINDTVSSAKRLTYSQFTRKSHEILMKKYRIPSEVAHQYATELAYSVTNGPSFLDKLGL